MPKIRSVKICAVAIAPGTLITQGLTQYKVVDEIGSGGFGVVYRAVMVKPIPGKEIAIKVPPAHVLTHPVWSKKFAREARILGNIRHRNVVRIIAFWEFPNGDKALAQELVQDASSLALAIKKSPTLAPSLFLQALYAMREFHGQGGSSAAIHRDLSPNNMLVDDDGILKVIDFGLAKEDPRLTQQLTQVQEWFGTQGCMSPEQVSNTAEVDHRTDLYALGRSFAASILDRHPLHVDCALLPEPWQSLCKRLTEHDAADRYQSATEALEAAYSLFSASDVDCGPMEFHAQEMNLAPLQGAETWSSFCAMYFAKQHDYTTRDLSWLAMVERRVFSSGQVDCETLFARIENSSGVANVENGTGLFDDADPLGTIYSRLFPSLGKQSKLACFKRLCDTAISMHRYHVMDCVRAAYDAETDPAVQGELMVILDGADPSNIIEGRGALPRTP